MATLEKLFKAFEALKVFQPHRQIEELPVKKKDQPLTSKEKIAHCSIIADAISSTNLRLVQDFPKFLGITIETFLMCCDDADADVRMVADECLNKTIKNLMETNLGRIQLELYKEIKKIGSPRVLRAALWRFADLCHLIRPQKCRPYFGNILPCILQMTRRSEEPLQETLATAIQKIFPVFGKFANDGEIKSLLKAFLNNLKSTSAVFRRTAATSLAIICQHSRKPSMFFGWLLGSLLEMILPVLPEKNFCSLLGAILCLRHVIPHLAITDAQDSSLRGSFGVRHREPEVHTGLDQLIQVYEALLHYTQHPDHNVVTTSLEALQQLLQTPPPLLLRTLLSSQGVGRTRIFAADIQELGLFQTSNEIGSLVSLATEENGIEDDLYSTADITSQIGRRVGSMEDSMCDSESTTSMGFPRGSDEDVSVVDEVSCASVTEDDKSEYSNIRISRVKDGDLTSAGIIGTLTRSPKCRPSLKGVIEGRSEEQNEDAYAWDPGTASPLVGSGVPFQVGNIGSFVDPDCPLTYCARHLCSLFLLTGSSGSLMPDKNVRVSVKTLALGCISAMLSIQPRIFFVALFKEDSEHSTDSPDNGQLLQDVVKFIHHPDPQMRGSAANLIGSLVKAVLRESAGKFDSWVQMVAVAPSSDVVTLQHLVEGLLLILKKDSSVACRMTLTALRLCLNSMLNSEHSQLGMQILNTLLQLTRHPYWLVKVELLELLADIPFKVICYLEAITRADKAGTSLVKSQVTRYQDHVFSDVIMPLLGDDDNRVRQAAATTIVRMIPNLFYPVDHPQHDPIVSLAKEKTEQFLDPIVNDVPVLPQPLVHGLVNPYDVGKVKPALPAVEMALSRIVNVLVRNLASSTSKSLTFGCCHTLCLLSEEYLVTIYPYAWTCSLTSVHTRVRTPTVRRQHSVGNSSETKSENIPCGGVSLVSFILSIATNTNTTMDLTAHQSALQLAGNLFAGTVFKVLQPKPDASADSAGVSEERWSLLRDKQITAVAEQLLTHLMRLLNILAHVIEEQSPTPPPSKTTLPSLPSPSYMSPIKRRNKVKEDVNAGASAIAGGQSKPVSGKSPQSGDKDEKSEKEKPVVKPASSLVGLGAFQGLPHYLRLFDVLKSAFSNYKLTLDTHGSERFSALLRTCLNAMSQVLEIATMTEIGEHAEEMLGYLKSTITMEATATLRCVQQLLKSLFGTNLASVWEGPQQTNTMRKPGRATRLTATLVPGLYQHCFTAPYAQFMQSLSDTVVRATSIPDPIETPTSWVGWVRRQSEKKLATLFKSTGKVGDKSSLASYIRLFEPLVIKALKQYTVTSSVDLHCQVLNLLSQLVQLRVNYCLLDSDQIFIGFVIKQFEYFEEGQIPQSEALLPSIFHFLVLLSYERYHSKMIIGVPKIIQLCDGIMASGQPPTTHAIPSLIPIVEDLFLMRGVVNKADAGKELETQREVVISMLLRLIHYHQVLEMFILILQQNRKEGEDKWKKLSRQIVDVVLPLLARQEIILDNQISLEILHRLFEAVAPSVFRPVDPLLKILFAPPHNLKTLLHLQRWFSMVLVVLRILIAQSKEEVVLGRLSELSLEVALFSDTLPIHMEMKKLAETAFPPHPNYLTRSSEEIIARFLMQVIGMTATEINRLARTPSIEVNQHTFLCQQLAHLLLYMMHMFQSGIYRRVATVCMTLIKEDCPPGYFSIQTINMTFLQLASVIPTVTLQWCNILILLNFDDQNFWSQVMRTTNRRLSASTSVISESTKSSTLQMCNLEMVRMGGLILFCDYVCENLTDAEHMTWLIVNHVNELVQLYSEPPVQDLIGVIHRNSAASGLFIQAIHARCENFSQPSFVKRTLSCLESIHPSQSGALVMLIISKFLTTHHLAVMRACVAMASHRVEMLLAESPDDGAHQLPLEDLDKHLDILHSAGLAKRHTQLVTLLLKLRARCYAELPQEVVNPKSTAIWKQALPDREFSPASVKSLLMDKDCYLATVRQQCFSSNACGLECAQLLSKLPYEDIVEIMLVKEFNLATLEECLSHGIQLSLSIYIKSSKGSSPCESPVPISPPPVGPEVALHRAAVVTLLQHVGNIVELMPRPHQVFLTCDKASLTPKEVKYHNRLVDLFSDSVMWELLFQLIPVLTHYLHTLPALPWFTEVPAESLSDVGRFCIVCLEAVHWLVDKDVKISPLHLQLALCAVHAILRNQNVAGVIGLRDHSSWVCSSIASIHRLVTSVLPEDSLPTLPASGVKLILPDPDLQRAAQACDQAAELLLWLERLLQENICPFQLPNFLKEPLKNIILGLARLPPVNSYCRTPPIMWQMGWHPDFTGMPRTVIPPLPVEYLQEREALKQFIFRVNTLGWTSRQQFEETWMALLGVLSATPMNESAGPEEEIERVQTSCLAVKCITALLLQTLLLPQTGNPQNSAFLHQKRDKPIAFLHTRCGKKLAIVRNIVHQKLQEMILKDYNQTSDVFISKGFDDVNLERQLSPTRYGLGQVSLDYLWTATGMLDEPYLDGTSSSTLSIGSSEFHQREQCITASGLDIHSCLHFLLDLYSQWMSPTTNSKVPLSLLTEATRSVVQLSDIFTEHAQFDWMLDTLQELHRCHPPEDEVIASYLIVGICKAAAVVGMEMEMAERLKKTLEWSLRSSYLPTRISTLHSLLHLLEQGSTEETLLFLTVAMDYISKHLENQTSSSSHSEEHLLMTWTLLFYILENYYKDMQETDFASKALQMSIQMASSPENAYPLSVYLVIISGLERLLLAEIITGKDAELLVKLSVDRFCQPNPVRAMAALGLMLSCMYTGKENDKWSPTSAAPGMELASVYTPQPPDAESLIVAMERVTVLFDRIKKGYPFEAEVVSQVLPVFLMDFFPPSDIMNKVIGEFISNQQPHPQLLASVVFRVFESVYLQSQQPLIQEWVMLSLSNFTQRAPVSMAMWSLSCFFISASTNCWIRALFPYVQRRMGKHELFDREMFCITALDFCRQLMDKSQQLMFRQTIASVAEPNTPYADLLTCL